MKNIGLYFGSFNPVHIGHLLVAETALEQAHFDEIWLVVSPQNPHKNVEDLLEFNLRFEMVQLAIESNDKIKACDIESFLKTPSYTIDTLNTLEVFYIDENANFSIIIGSDCLESFKTWKNYESILQNYDIYIYPRDNHEINLIGNRMFLLDVKEKSDISSTFIRGKIKEHKIDEIRYLLPEKVLNYIIKNNLYV